MEIFGIKFAPLNVPLRRRLQTLATGTWFVVMAFGGFIGLFVALYLVLFTHYRWLTLLYLYWAWVVDRDACDRGGRASEWVRSWSWWKYFVEYFPIRTELPSPFKLDPEKNYLFCFFPHGMLSTGTFAMFGTNYGRFKELFPHHAPHSFTLAQHFHMPFFRELAFWLGGCAASVEAINRVLGDPRGGNAGALVVGGAAESYYSRPGQYRILVKKRKGFVKLALKNGAPLVPCFSFGETDLFNQVNNPEGSLLRKVQEMLRKVIGLAPALPIGRGFFQYSFGLVPMRRPVTCVGKNLVNMNVETEVETVCLIDF